MDKRLLFAAVLLTITKVFADTLLEIEDKRYPK